MRLITRQLHRAFPELDQFSDYRCREFVRRANSSWVAVITRWVLAGGLGFIVTFGTLIGTIAAQRAIQNRLPDSAWVWIVDIAMVGLPLACGFLTLMMLRDWQLRRRVRRMILLRGTCQKCGYLLLGIPIGADRKLTCPECGLAADAGLALEALVDVNGLPDTESSKSERRFTSSLAADIERERLRRAWWSKLRRKLFRAAFVVVLVLGLTAGWAWWTLHQWSHQASAGRTASALLDQMALAVFPKDVRDRSPNGWEQFEGLIQAFQRVNDAVLARPEYAPGGPVFASFRPYVSLTSLLPTLEHSIAGQDKAETRRLASDVFDATMSSDVLTWCDRVSTGQWWVRPRMWVGTQPLAWGGRWSPLLSQLGYIAPVRMYRAIGTGDRAEYLRALKHGLEFADVLEQQVDLADIRIGRNARAAIFQRVIADAGRYPDREWLQAVAEVIEHRGSKLDRHRLIDIFRQWQLDLIGWFYSDPVRVAKYCAIGPSSLDLAPPGTIRPVWVGTYLQNINAINQRHDQAHVVVASSPMLTWKADLAKTAVPALPLDELSWSNLSGVVLQCIAAQELHKRACCTLQVWDRWMKIGRFPSTLNELADRKGVGVPINPATGKLFAYQGWSDEDAGPPWISVDP